jgi:hypothetical protein
MFIASFPRRTCIFVCYSRWFCGQTASLARSLIYKRISFVHSTDHSIRSGCLVSPPLSCWQSFRPPHGTRENAGTRCQGAAMCSWLHAFFFVLPSLDARPCKTPEGHCHKYLSGHTGLSLDLTSTMQRVYGGVPGTPRQLREGFRGSLDPRNIPKGGIGASCSPMTTHGEHWGASGVLLGPEKLP